MTTWGPRAAIVVAVLALAGTAASCSSGGQAADETPTIRSSPTLGRTQGPNGETATAADALRLSSREVAKLRGGDHSAALVWHEDSDFTEAVTAGVLDEFRPLGIRVVAQTSAGFDAARQKADIETVAAKKPAVMLTLPVGR